MLDGTLPGLPEEPEIRSLYAQCLPYPKPIFRRRARYSKQVMNEGVSTGSRVSPLGARWKATKETSHGLLKLTAVFQMVPEMRQ